VLVVEAFQQPFSCEAAEVVSYLARRVGRAKKRRNERPELSVGEAVGGPEEVAEGVEDGGHSRLPEFQRGRRLSGGGAGGLDEISELRGRSNPQSCASGSVSSTRRLM